MAERVRNAIERAPWTQRAVTASLGVATMEERELREATENKPISALLLARADEALYFSKANGRNCVTHYAHAG